MSNHNGRSRLILPDRGPVMDLPDLTAPKLRPAMINQIGHDKGQKLIALIVESELPPCAVLMPVEVAVRFAAAVVAECAKADPPSTEMAPVGESACPVVFAGYPGTLTLADLLRPATEPTEEQLQQHKAMLAGGNRVGNTEAATAFVNAVLDARLNPTGLDDPIGGDDSPRPGLTGQ